jgi:hypothetical protein
LKPLMVSVSAVQTRARRAARAYLIAAAWCTAKASVTELGAAAFDVGADVVSIDKCCGISLVTESS